MTARPPETPETLRLEASNPYVGTNRTFAGTAGANGESRPTPERDSYAKTTWTALAAIGLLAALAAATLTWDPPWGWSALALLALIAVPALLTVVGGMVVLHRDTLEGQQRPDPFYRYFSRDPSGRFDGRQRWLRRWSGSALRPGDVVRVREPADIEATLDASGQLNGLPYMPEMLDWIGRDLVVDRRIDKINDWMGGNELRRTTGLVTLVAVRCSGTGHGGCQAGCQILWNERWLQRVPRGIGAKAAPTGAAQPVERAMAAQLQTAASRLCDNTLGVTQIRYICQATELVRASTPMSPWDLRQDVRPLLNGNLSLAGYLIGLLTLHFNKVQALRGGAGYPVTAPQLEQGPTPLAEVNLQPGDIVQVRDKREIGLTLHKNHNRGMWFGKETLRFCNQRYRVRQRVERIIHERSGEMIQLKTPGIILDGACGSGEFLRFCPQNEYVFWREIWLRRVEP